MKKFLALMLALIMTVCIGSTAMAASIDKTAVPLDENDMTRVTLSVGGDEDKLGVDIIYMLGAFLSREDVEANTMIDCLYTTISEIVAGGTPVKFGMVPYSSTAEPVMPWHKYETVEDMADFKSDVYEAIQTAGDVYDGINMENAFVTAKEMFNDSDLKNHPERQHLVMISSGNTYYFNSGANNEYIATVPVRLIINGTDSKGLFAYPEKVWMRARNNNTNSYPIPYHIVQEYNNNNEDGKYKSLWDCYWHWIDIWAKADVAAGDSVVFEATTREAGDFIARWLVGGGFVKHSNQSQFSYTGNGAIIAGLGEADLEGYVTLDFSAEGTITAKAGPNPLVVPEAAHAIGNERAMWEAYNYMKKNITGAGINFYPVYQPLRADGSTTNGNYVHYDYTNQYIGHSFMNMLAGGKAVTFSADKTFFDPIKKQIMSTVSVGSYVEDYIGYDSEKGNFAFIDRADAISLTVGGVAYTTAKVETAEGATSSYAFTAPGAEEATFSLDYYAHETDKEKFIWTFGEDVTINRQAKLTYGLELKDKAAEGRHVVDTNISATLYPKDSEGKKGSPEVFPIPNVEYEIIPATVSHTVTKVWDDENGANRPASVIVRLRQDGQHYGAAVVLNENSGWTFTWTNLPAGHTYTAYEAVVPAGYTASTVDEEGKTVITNTLIPVETPEEPTPTPEQPTPTPEQPTPTPRPNRPTTTIPETRPPMASRPPVANTIQLDDEDTMTILDEEVPLAEAPKTGDVSTVLMATSALAGAGLMFTGRKKKAAQQEEQQDEEA
ncbi:MAG: Cna B-type domain-containing protein [Clostridia bacterium]|nr:Cna B-type domain-containing protein [Clostridia bacterium]